MTGYILYRSENWTLRKTDENKSCETKVLRRIYRRVQDSVQPESVKEERIQNWKHYI